MTSSNNFGNLLKNIYLGEFDNLENLKELELDNNGVEFIGKMVFRNMQKLEKLSIEQSHIATIRNDFHYGLESLSYITYNFGGIQEHFHVILHANKSTRAAISFDFEPFKTETVICKSIKEYRIWCFQWFRKLERTLYERKRNTEPTRKLIWD